MFCQIALQPGGSMIDLLRLGKNGGIDIVDFKISMSGDLDGVGIDLQLDLYALGAEESFGLKVERTTVHFLGDGKLQSTAWSEERRAKAISRLTDILNQIDAGDFPPNMITVQPAMNLGISARLPEWRDSTCIHLINCVNYSPMN